MLLLSTASGWEMQIKAELGKLRLTRPLSELVRDQESTNELQILPVELAHVLRLAELPPHHKDPFDRILIAQAITEGAVLVSNDRIIESYPVEVLW